MAKKFPHIKKISLSDCNSAEGCVVVIDVLRAFTTAAFAFGSGAEEILVVSTAEEAFALKEKDPNLLLMGEDMGRRIPGFDFGNSPVEISKADLLGKRLVQRTTAGTQGVVRCRHAKQMLAASFAVAEATVRQIVQWEPQIVTFVITGSRTGDEDLALAEYLEKKIQEEIVDPTPYLKRVADAPDAFGISCPSYLQDVQTAIKIDRFSFAMQVHDGLRLLKNKSAAATNEITAKK